MAGVKWLFLPLGFSNEFLGGSPEIIFLLLTLLMFLEDLTSMVAMLLDGLLLMVILDDLSLMVLVFLDGLPLMMVYS